MEEGAVRERARRHIAEPVIEGRKAARQSGHHGHLLRCIAHHDLSVLVSCRLAAQRREQHVGVVGHEPVHRRPLAIAGCVEGRLRLIHAQVALVEDPEQLRVDVRELLTRVGIRRVHGRRDAVRYSPVPVFDPLGDRVGEILADHVLERGDLTGLVQAPEQVVERTVLEHHHHDVIERVLRRRFAQSRPSSIHSLGPLGSTALSSRRGPPTPHPTPPAQSRVLSAHSRSRPGSLRGVGPGLCELLRTP